VLRKIFGAKRDEVTGGSRKLHNEELRNLYYLLNVIGMIKSKIKRWAGHAAHIREKRNAYSVVVGKADGKRSLGRLRRRWRVIIKWIFEK
jgi:hypothetical protein